METPNTNTEHMSIPLPEEEKSTELNEKTEEPQLQAQKAEEVHSEEKHFAYDLPSLETTLLNSEPSPDTLEEVRASSLLVRSNEGREIKGEEKKSLFYTRFSFWFALLSIVPAVYFLPHNTPAFIVEGVFFSTWIFWTILTKKGFFGGIIMAILTSGMAFLFLVKDSLLAGVNLEFYRDVNFWVQTFEWSKDTALPFLMSPVPLFMSTLFFGTWILWSIIMSKRKSAFGGFGIAMSVLIIASISYISWGDDRNENLHFLAQKYESFQQILGGEIKNSEDDFLTSGENLKAVASETPLPDLTIENINWEMEYIPEGRKVTYTLSLKNVGNAKTNGDFLLETKGWEGNITLKKSNEKREISDSLAPGEEKIIPVEIILPTAVTEVTFLAELDSENSIEELDELNNMAKPNRLFVGRSTIEEDRSDCPVLFNPVCGKKDLKACSAGSICDEEVTYRNICDLGEDGSDFVHQGKCTKDLAECEEEYAPVCGKKGEKEKTYNNECELNKANAELLYEGACNRRIRE